MPINETESRFTSIDPKLVQLCEKLGAELTKDRPSYPEVLRTFEERRIDWIKDGIFLAIIIQPTFNHDGVDQEKWNFLTVAWKDEGKAIHRTQQIHELVRKEKFEIIQSHIDTLLEQAAEILLKTTDNDLS